MLSVVLDSSHTPTANYAFSDYFIITNDNGQEEQCYKSDRIWEPYWFQVRNWFCSTISLSISIA